jgi:predicted nicotinamide N-methyase
MENSLVVSEHELSLAEVESWFSANVGEIALCKKCSTIGNAVLVELVLENETEVAMDRFAASFAAHARRPELHEYYATTDHVRTELHLVGDWDVRLELNSGVGGGTGSRLWSGGLLLAEWIKQAHRDLAVLSLPGRSVLELGAGAAALPSIAASQCGAKCVVATDCVSSVVDQMQANLARNAPSVSSRTLDWAVAGKKRYNVEDQFDVILFSDAIYNQRGAFFLSLAIDALLGSGGIVIGALPDTRTGISNFESDLAANGYFGTTLTLDEATLVAAAKPVKDDKAGVIADEDLREYRLVMWQRDRK